MNDQPPVSQARDVRTRRLLAAALILSILIGWAGLILFYRPNSVRGSEPRQHNSAHHEAPKGEAPR